MLKRVFSGPIFLTPHLYPIILQSYKWDLKKYISPPKTATSRNDKCQSLKKLRKIFIPNKETTNGLKAYITILEVSLKNVSNNVKVMGKKVLSLEFYNQHY